jgi:hypothetical protein
VLGDARLLVSELVSDPTACANAGLAADGVVHVGAEVTGGMLRLEVDDALVDGDARGECELGQERPGGREDDERGGARGAGDDAAATNASPMPSASPAAVVGPAAPAAMVARIAMPSEPPIS